MNVPDPPESDANGARLIELETQVTFLEDTIGKLNEAILDADRRLRRAEQQIEQLTGRVKTFEETGPGDDLPHEKPPHY